jgi:hypothetical protein
MNPLAGLLRSRKFWLLVLDTAISLILYFVGKYAPAGVFEDVKVIILALQPVFIVIIGAIAYEDGQLKRAGRQLHG